MGDLSNIFSRLNVMEQIQLNQYINREINKKVLENAGELEKLAAEKEKNLSDMNDKTWQIIETSIHLAMRENRISEERIKKIDTRVLELNKNSNGTLLIGKEQKSEYKIVGDNDWQKMIELLADANCKNCKDHSKNCEVYPLMKKYKVPYSGEKGKCKYAYFKIGKKVV